MERAVSLDPESVIHRWTHGYHNALLGKWDAVRRAFEWMQQRVPQMPYTIQLGSLLSATEGRHNEALADLGQLNVLVYDGHTRYHLGESFVLAGNTTRGLELIRGAVETSFYPAEFTAKYNPFLASLRGDPEFDRIVAIAEKRAREFAR